MNFYKIRFIVLFFLVMLKFLIHVLYSQRYGYHGDELYFIDSGKNLAFGYVDFAPFVAWIARLSGELFGYGLSSIRFFPALSGSCVVLLIILITKELGGGLFSSILSALCFIFAPAFLRIYSILCIPAFEVLIWTLGSYISILIIKYNKQKYWLMFGIVAGIGLMIKHSMLFWGSGILFGFLLTSKRKFLFNRWFLLAGFLALILFLPNLIWQYQNDWATFELFNNLSSKFGSLHVPRSKFLLDQIIFMHPIFFPVWILGFVYLLSVSDGQFRYLFWMFIFISGFLIFSKAKSYYLSAAYPILFASGGVFLEYCLKKYFTNSKLAKCIIITIIVISGISTSFLALPILPLTLTEKIIKKSIGKFANVENLTHEFRFQQGWIELTHEINSIYLQMNQNERDNLYIITLQTGPAGALRFFGEKYNLTEIVGSGHFNYYIWSFHNQNFLNWEKNPKRILMTVGFNDPRLMQYLFKDVKLEKIFDHPFSVPKERNLHIYISKNPSKPFIENWQLFKRYRPIHLVEEKNRYNDLHN